MRVNPAEVKTSLFHAYMVAAVAPRPIAFASTIDREGKPNLAPFSFFNAFGSHPPLLVFSPARSVRDNINKNTLENIYEVKEVVINVVNYNLVQQTSLASTEFPKGVNEFIKAGLTPIASEMVKPFRVKESPVQMECKVLDVIEMGQHGGAANLVICEIVLMHIDDSILTEDGKIDPQKLDLVGRMGGNLYSRASGSALFEVEKPNRNIGIGFDQLPDKIRTSKYLNGNDLGKLANVTALPTKEEIETSSHVPVINELKNKYINDPSKLEENIFMLAKNLLERNEVMEAWKVLLYRPHP